MALSEPLCKTTVPSNHSPPSELGWLKYALASFFFGAVGQFSMGFLSEDLTSRFIISLGDLTFVIFFGFLKFLYFKYKNKRWAKISDCAWFDSNGAFKKGTFKYLLLCITTRFIYGFAIILAYAEAKDHDMNLGIVLSIRSSEALFVALWTYILLKEKLSHCKLLGLFILIGGIVGLSMPKDTEDGFSVLAVIYALVAALVSSFRNFSVKRLAKLDVDGDTIILHAVFWADLITVILGCILCFWGIGFNHEFYDTYFDQESIEFTWTRFGMATFVGFAIFFSLTTTANANQKGYAGPAVAIKNSSLLAVTIISWIVFGDIITTSHWIFIGVLMFGLFVTSAGDSILNKIREKKQKKLEKKLEDNETLNSLDQK